jgi:hypothetical protein
MEIYRAYFRDDPTFDQTNVTRAIPQLTCPKVDRAMLVRTGNYAMDSNFGWPRPPLPTPPLAWTNHMETLPASIAATSTQLTLELTGAGGGAYTIAWENQRLVCGQRGRISPKNPLFRTRGDTLASILQKKISLEIALRNGRALLVASADQMDEVLFLLQSVLKSLTENETSVAISPNQVQPTSGLAMKTR